MLPNFLKLSILVSLFISVKCFIRPLHSRMVGHAKRETQLNSYPIHDAAENGDLEKVMSLVNNDKSLLKLVETEGIKQ